MSRLCITTISQRPVFFVITKLRSPSRSGLGLPCASTAPVIFQRTSTAATHRGEGLRIVAIPGIHEPIHHRADRVLVRLSAGLSHKQKWKQKKTNCDDSHRSSSPD